MKTFHFIKVNPAGNMTILYDRSNVLDSEIQPISKAAMNDLNLFAEQVGFIEGTHLQMMGGEFCGNASRSFASYLAFKDKDFQGDEIYEITCSGEDSLLKVHVRQAEDDHLFLAKIKMPSYISINKMTLQSSSGSDFTVCEVLFSGISHFIYEGPVNEAIMETIHAYCTEKDYDAYGIMFLNASTLMMKPYVKVQGFDGVWENSCGSGTTAVGYYLKTYKNIDSAKIVQPGGWLEVSLDEEGIYIDGPVEIVAEGNSYMNL